jgi:uncharacterized repeat protein (TIGR03803 family)
MAKLRAWTYAGLLIALISFTVPSWAATRRYSVIYSFQGGTDGAAPDSTMIFDAAGNLYGTTQAGGTANAGTVFELSPGTNGWTEKVLYSFLGEPDGYLPNSTLAMDKAGNLYGTTGNGGDTCASFGSCGTVFELTPSTNGGPWTETILYSFQGRTDGAHPNGVILDKLGNLYGTTISAGNLSCVGLNDSTGCGTVFELSLAGGTWTETTIYTFQGSPDAASPQSGLTMDTSGNLYGATTLGGSGNGEGTVYELSPSNGAWSERILYSFEGIQFGPSSTLVFDSGGDLVGTAGGGGCCGEVFALMPRPGGKWAEAIVFRFSYTDGGFEHNYTTIALDSHNNIYGTSDASGFYHAGTVYELQQTAQGIREAYYSFCPQRVGCPDGAAPMSGVTLDSAGSVYGTTWAGGSGDGGVVYEIAP